MNEGFDEFEARSLAEDYGMTPAAQSMEPAARSIELITEEIRFYKQTAATSIVEIGRRLIEAKKQLPHGEWSRWLQESVAFSERSAQNYMRLAEGYGESATVADLGTRKALALLALDENERAGFLEENDVSAMSARELEEALRERDEAEAARKDAERAAERMRGDLTAAQAKLSAAKTEAVQTARRLEEAKQRETKARDRAKELEAELRTLREKPVEVAVEKVVDRAAVEAARRDAEKAMEDKLAAAKREAEAAAAEIENARGAAQAALEEAAALRRQMQAADGKTAEFRLLFEQWQRGYQELDRRVEEIAREDGEKGSRLRAAVRAAAERMGR